MRMSPELQQRIHDEMIRGTPRYQRAVRFVNEVQAMLRDFLPTDRECRHSIEDTLMEIGFVNNAAIISVPPEKDHLDKMQLERAMIEQHPIVLSKSRGEG